MKQLLPVFFCLFGAFSNGQIWYPEPDKKELFDLKGPVKTLIHDDNCEPYESGIHSYLGCHYEITFNTAGFVTRMESRIATNSGTDTVICFYINDTLLETMINPWYRSSFYFKYDAYNRISEIDEYGGNQLSEKFRFYYDSTLNQMTATRSYPDGKKTRLFERFQYNYDESGKVLSISLIDHKHRPYETNTYTYNASGQLISKTVWIKPPKKKDAFKPHPEYEFISYKYDEKGRVIEEYRCLEQEKIPLEKKTFTYNAACLLYQTFDTLYLRKSYYLHEIEYDSLHRKTSETVYGSFGKMSSFILYAYDEQNNLVLEEKTESVYQTSRQGDLETKWEVTKRKEYEYDVYGNWIKMIYLDWDGTEKTTTRIITYYE